MESSNRFLFLSSLLLLVFISSAAGASKQRPGFVGGYQTIKDMKDPYVVEIAKFAVSEHNKDASDNLVFVKVLSGEQQVVAGMNYKLIFVARHGGHGAGGNYLAEVYDKPWMKIRNLTSFEKA